MKEYVHRERLSDREKKSREREDKIWRDEVLEILIVHEKKYSLLLLVL